MTEYKRQQAILWLRAEAERCRRAPKQNGCPMQPEWQEMIEVCEVAIEALETVRKAEKKGT